MSIRIYTDIGHYQPTYRADLIDLLKPFVGKAEGYTVQQRVQDYGISPGTFDMAHEIADCDWAILPMSWNYYHQTRRLHDATDFVNIAGAVQKRVLSWVSGDFGVKVPDFKHVVVLRQNGYRSKLPETHLGMPVFFTDPLKGNLAVQEKREKPVIGFCGQALGNWLKYGIDTTRTLFRNLGYYAGISFREPHAATSSTYLRSNLLNTIAADNRVESNFIRRRYYRAGAKTADERQKTTAEYFQNMAQSDYVLCVRGGGNFSARLYETLAMGKIPVFVNTDCLLPFEQEIPWHNHMVWVDRKDSGQIVDKVLRFHSNLTEQDFIHLQHANRELWETRLRLPTFFQSIFQS